MNTAILAIGAVLIFEGLVFALAPQRLDEVMALLARMPVDIRRLVGLATLAAGVGLLWVGHWMGV